MMTMSKALSAPQARTYHAREFVSEPANYWSRDQQGHSEWQGKLATEWGLKGEVGAEHFARLTEGEHPTTQEQLVWHESSRTYENRYGKEVTSVGHRAGWDATISALKSVSLTVLVGGDERVREAHWESVQVALSEFERYTQARMGNVREPEKTGKFIAATFEHDTARPVDGYAAPQLHTHVVVFNVAESKDGDTARAAGARAVPVAGICDGGVSDGTRRPVAGIGIRDRTRPARPAGDQGLHTGVPGGFESAPRARSRLGVERRSGARAREPPRLRRIAARDSKEIQSAAEVLHRHRETWQPGTVIRPIGWCRARSANQRSAADRCAQGCSAGGDLRARAYLSKRAAIQDERAILQAALGAEHGAGECQPGAAGVRTDERRAKKSSAQPSMRPSLPVGSTRPPPWFAWSARSSAAWKTGQLRTRRASTPSRARQNPSRTKVA